VPNFEALGLPTPTSLSIIQARATRKGNEIPHPNLSNNRMLGNKAEVAGAGRSAHYKRQHSEEESRTDLP